MATLDTLQKVMEDCLKELQAQSKGGGGAGAGSTNAKKAETLSEAFHQAFKKSEKGGLGIQQGAMDLAGSIGGTLGKYSAGGPIGMAAGATVEIGMALAQVPNTVKEFVEGLHSANRALSEFSPSMANVMALSDLGDMMRSMRAGEAIAGSAGELSASRAGLLDTLQPLDNEIQTLRNELGGLITDATTEVLESSGVVDFLTFLVEGMREIVKWIGVDLDIKRKQKIDPDQTPLGEWLEGIEDIELKERGLRVAPLAPAPPPLIGGGRFDGGGGHGGDF